MLGVHLLLSFRPIFMSTSTAAYSYTNKVTREKYDRVVAFVRENPEITGAEIAKHFHPDKPKPKHFTHMLQNLCADRRLKYLEGDRYIVVQP